MRIAGILTWALGRLRRSGARRFGVLYLGDRPSARERGYDTKWERARAEFLLEHPLCQACLQDGIVRVATVVDHIKPHRGDKALFWSRKNWQSLCRVHHSASKQRAEARGVQAIGCGPDGLPNDPAHPWRG